MRIFEESSQYPIHFGLLGPHYLLFQELCHMGIYKMQWHIKGNQVTEKKSIIKNDQLNDHNDELNISK